MFTNSLWEDSSSSSDLISSTMALAGSAILVASKCVMWSLSKNFLKLYYALCSSSHEASTLTVGIVQFTFPIVI